VVCTHIIIFVTQLTMHWRFRHRDVVVVIIIVLRGLWSAVHGSGGRKRLVLVIVVMLRGLWWSGRRGALVTMAAIPLLLSLWLSAVVQSLCRVLREMVGVMRLGRLGKVLAVEAKVKVIDFVLYGGSVAQILLGFGRLQLAGGRLISWLGLGGLSRAVQLHIVQVLVNSGLTLMRGGFVEIRHGSFYLVLAIHGLRGLLIVIVVDTPETLVLVRVVIPRLLGMSKFVLVSRGIGEVGCLRDTCFVGSVGNGNDGGTVACRHTAQQRRLQATRIASDLCVERGERGTSTAIGGVACRGARRGRIRWAESREGGYLCWSLLGSRTVDMALVSGLWTGISASRPRVLRVGLWRMMWLRWDVWKRVGWLVVAEV
jgi:hypothetical protein